MQKAPLLDIRSEFGQLVLGQHREQVRYWVYLHGLRLFHTTSVLPCSYGLTTGSARKPPRPVRGPGTVAVFPAATGAAGFCVFHSRPFRPTRPSNASSRSARRRLTAWGVSHPPAGSRIHAV